MTIRCDRIKISPRQNHASGTNSGMLLSWTITFITVQYKRMQKDKSICEVWMHLDVRSERSSMWCMNAAQCGMWMWLNGMSERGSMWDLNAARCDIYSTCSMYRLMLLCWLIVLRHTRAHNHFLMMIFKTSSIL